MTSDYTPPAEAVEAAARAMTDDDPILTEMYRNQALRALTAAGPIIAAEVRRTPDGCAWCCASNPPGVKPGSDHDICPAQRDRIARKDQS